MPVKQCAGTWNWKQYLTVEPALILFYLPFLLTGILNENIELDKACRAELGLSSEVCDMVINNPLDCEPILEEQDNSTKVEKFDWENHRALLALDNDLFNFTVCKAQREALTIKSYYFGIRKPIGAIFTAIVVIFVGGWSDRYNLRKPLLYLPFLGAIIYFAILILSTIFMDTLPSIYTAVVSDVFINIFGGMTMFSLGAFIYMTLTTKEADRTFRLGVFAIVGNLLPLTFTFSGLYADLGYLSGHIIALLIEIFGFLHVIFFVPEPKTSKFAFENPAFENDEAPKALAVQKSKCAEIFDISLIQESFKVLFKKRSRPHVHFLIVLLVFTYWMLGMPGTGESDYTFEYTKLKLKWDGNDYSVYVGIYTSIVGGIGTFLATTVFLKLMKLSDSLVGLIASITTLVSKLMFAFAETSTFYYIAGGFTLFDTMPGVTLKSISSTLVFEDEIGKLFSLMSFLDITEGFIIPPLYTAVFSSTIYTFPGAIYILGEAFLIHVVTGFIIIYILLKKIKKKESKANDELKVETFRKIEDNTRF